MQKVNVSDAEANKLMDEISTLDFDNLKDYLKKLLEHCTIDEENTPRYLMMMLLATINVSYKQGAKFTWDNVSTSVILLANAMLYPNESVGLSLICYSKMLDSDAKKYYKGLKPEIVDVLISAATAVLDAKEENKLSEEQINHLRQIKKGNLPFGFYKIET